MTRNRIFTDGLLSYIKRPGGALGTRRTRRACRTSRAGRSGRTGGTCRACGAGRACGSGGAGHGDQIKVRRGVRRPGSAAAVGAVEGTVVVDQCAQVIRYPGNELCDIIQPFTGRAGGTCGADRTGRSSGTRGSGSARCARGTRSPRGSRGPGRSNGAGRAVGGT